MGVSVQFHNSIGKAWILFSLHAKSKNVLIQLGKSSASKIYISDSPGKADFHSANSSD